MIDCLFCKIVLGEIPARKVFENDEFLAFSPIHQVSKGHTLVIPKRHFENVFDFESKSFERLMGIAQTVSKELVKNNEATGINLLHASGKDAQQSVFHFHLHLVPRYKEDGLDLWLKNKL